MSLGIINIVEGYTKEQKQLLIQETKKACMEGFGVSMDHSFVSIQEIKAENCDEQTKHMQCLYIFTTFGKTQEGKEADHARQAEGAEYQTVTEKAGPADRSKLPGREGRACHAHIRA